MKADKSKEFNAGRAMWLRLMDAVNAAGGSDVLFEQVLAGSFEIIKGADMSRMRELGGFSTVIKSVIDAGFDGDVRSYLMHNVGELRERLQIRYSERIAA